MQSNAEIVHASEASPPEQVRVLVAIPTLDEAEHIEVTLRQVLSDHASFRALRVVVVDGGSQDGTQALVARLAEHEPQLCLLENPARLQSAGINLAVARYGAGADVLVRCDAHALYPQHFCRQLVAALARTGADAVVVPLDSIGTSGVSRAIAWVCNTPIGTGGSAHRAGRQSQLVDHGHHAAFRVDSFRRAGGYDPSFSHNEDAELDCRQRALGARIYLEASIRVGYLPRRDLRALFRQYFNYGKGRSRTLRRHPSSLRLRQLAVPVHLLCALACIALGLLVHAAFLAWPLFYLSVLLLTSLYFGISKRSIWGLATGPVALVMHSAWALGFLGGVVTLRERLWLPERAEQPS